MLAPWYFKVWIFVLSANHTTHAYGYASGCSFAPLCGTHKFMIPLTHIHTYTHTHTMHTHTHTHTHTYTHSLTTERGHLIKISVSLLEELLYTAVVLQWGRTSGTAGQRRIHAHSINVKLGCQQT